MAEEENRESLQLSFSSANSMGNNNGDSILSHGYSGPIYFMDDQLSDQHGNSQIDPSANSISQNRHIRNPMPMQETHDSFSARNQNLYQTSGLIPVEPVTGLEGITASLSRLHFPNRITSPARPNGIDSVFGARFAMDANSSNLYNEQEQLQMMRVRAAVNGLSAAARQGSDSFAYSQHQFRNIQNDELPWTNPSRTNMPEFPYASIDLYRQMTPDQLRLEQLLLSQPLNNFRTMNDVKGKVVLAAKDCCGSRFLQNKIEERNPDDINLIFREVMDQLHELMTDHCGSHVIQKLFEAVNVQQMNTLISFIIQNDSRLLNTCVDTNGSRAIQKLMLHFGTTDQIVSVVAALIRITAFLAKNLNGGYVIQHCFKVFPLGISKYILDVVADNCLDISTNKSGCSVIQRCLQYASTDIEALARLTGEIVPFALLLSEDQYGNYVLQFIVKMQNSAINQAIVARLLGKFGQLSKNKHSSNVVEDLLRYSEDNLVRIITDEIMEHHNFLSVVQDPYGNYVVQTAVKHSQGPTQQALSKRILDHSVYLHSHLYGKRVMEVAKRYRRRNT